MKDQVGDVPSSLAQSFQCILSERDLFSKVIECFPYPIQVFSVDGTARIMNKATLEMIGIKSVESHIDKYNCFDDPIVQDNGVMDQLKRVLTGETVYLTGFNAPYKDLVRYHDVKQDRDIQTIISDITCFPLVGEDGEIEYFVAIFIFREVYRGKEEIALAKEYIETHWQEPFNLGEIAKAACLSKAHFTKLFNKHTGVTPHEYYVNYKIRRLKEKLKDTNLSIAQAFAACNIQYNGYTARVFKEKTGFSPSAYRQKSE